MITLRTPTGDKAAAAVTVRTPTGDKAVARMTLRTPTGDKEFYTSSTGGLTIDIAPVTATGSGGSGGELLVSTAQVTANTTGGTAPYSYSWAFTSGDSGWSITAPSAAATRFTNNVTPVDSRSGIFTVTVTDARGRTGTAAVEAIVYNFGSFGGL